MDIFICQSSHYLCVFLAKSKVSEVKRHPYIHSDSVGEPQIKKVPWPLSQKKFGNPCARHSMWLFGDTVTDAAPASVIPLFSPSADISERNIERNMGLTVSCPLKAATKQELHKQTYIYHIKSQRPIWLIDSLDCSVMYNIFFQNTSCYELFCYSV